MIGNDKKDTIEGGKYFLFKKTKKKDQTRYYKNAMWKTTEFSVFHQNFEKFR